MRLPAKKLVARHIRARDVYRSGWTQHEQDMRDYALPFRGALQKGETAGSKRTNKLYDSTAVSAAHRGSGKLQRGLTPDFQQWFGLVPGPFITDEGQRQQAGKLLQDWTKIAWHAINQGGFSVAAGEMYQDLYAGTGAMMILKGDGPEQLIDFISVPSEMIDIEEDGRGRVKRWMYEEEIALEDIASRWPRATLPAATLKQLKEKPEDKVTLTIACSRKEGKGEKGFDYQVCLQKPAAEIWHETTRTPIFITPRFFKLPGETRGRGPLSLAMPHIKSLNKGVELQLKAAAFAVLGSWMVSDDGAYNPATSVLVPGGRIKVKSTGGVRGASMVDLGLPKQFDVASIVNNEIRAQIKEMLLDEQLPPEEGAVRSPTEIIARLKRLTADIQSAFGRLQAEIVIPIVQRTLDILDQWDLLPEMPQIDQMFIKLQVMSPLADSQALEEAEKATRWISIAMEILGEMSDLVVARERAAVYLHEAMAAPAAVILTKDERDKASAAFAEAAKAQAAAQMPAEPEAA